MKAEVITQLDVYVNIWDKEHYDENACDPASPNTKTI